METQVITYEGNKYYPVEKFPVIDPIEKGSIIPVRAEREIITLFGERKTVSYELKPIFDGKVGCGFDVWRIHNGKRQKITRGNKILFRESFGTGFIQRLIIGGEYIQVIRVKIYMEKY